MIEERFLHGCACRHGMIVCGHVRAMIRAHGPHRHVTVRFLTGIDPALREDLQRLIDARGYRGPRVAETLAPIDLELRSRSGPQHRGMRPCRRSTSGYSGRRRREPGSEHTASARDGILRHAPGASSPRSITAGRGRVKFAPVTIQAMNGWQWLLIAAGAVLALYAAFVATLMIAGRRRDARAVAGYGNTDSTTERS